MKRLFASSENNSEIIIETLPNGVEQATTTTTLSATVEPGHEYTGERQLDLDQAKILLTLINNQLAKERRRMQQSDMKDMNKMEWYFIAVVLDRLCLLVYAVIGMFGLFIILI